MIHDSLKRRDVADAKAIGLRIRKARKSRSWTIRDLAEAVGVAEQTVACWECGSQTPGGLSMLIRLCYAMRRTPQHVLMGWTRNDGKRRWE